MKIYPRNFYRTNHNGFTLIEMLAATLIIGIIAAISAPNLMALLSHHRVRNAMVIINGAVKEAQRQAIRQGINCVVTLDAVNRTMTGNPASCLPEQRVIDDSPESSDEVTIRSNIAPPPATVFNISFSSKGNTTTGGTIVVSSDATDTQSCFVISNGLGITRTGDYTGAKTGAIDTAQCNSN